jgi:hypothetical protein
MEGERYVGERRALRHFLQELQPLVAAVLGRDSVLSYRIGRALRAGDLASLRLAREVFHRQPEDLKRQLMRGIFQAPPGQSERGRGDARGAGSGPLPLIRFDAYPSARSEDIGLSVQLDHDHGDEVPLKVLVSAGTLPGSAAEALRQIARWIERDRRLLSARRWQGADGCGLPEPASRGEPGGDNVDRA